MSNITNCVFQLWTLELNTIGHNLINFPFSLTQFSFIRLIDMTQNARLIETSGVITRLFSHKKLYIFIINQFFVPFSRIMGKNQNE
jgi:hypothetical protein